MAHPVWVQLLFGIALAAVVIRSYWRFAHSSSTGKQPNEGWRAIVLVVGGLICLSFIWNGLQGLFEQVLE